MAPQEYELELSCPEATRRNAVLAMFVRKQEIGASTVSKQPMIPRILVRVFSELLMPEKYNQGIDNASLNTILLLQQRDPSISPAIVYLFNQFSMIRGKVAFLFEAAMTIHYVTKIKEWADRLFRPVISQYCQEALDELRKVSVPEIPGLITWRRAAKNSSTSVPVTEEVTEATELTGSTSRTESAELGEPLRGLPTSQTSQVSEIADNVEQSAISEEVVNGTPELPASPVAQDVIESTQSTQSSSQSASSVIASDELRQGLVNITHKLPHIQKVDLPVQLTQSSSSIQPAQSSPPTQSSRPAESIQSSTKRVVEAGNSTPSNRIHPRKRIRLETARLEDLNVSSGTVLTILSRGYEGSTAVYVGPAKTNTHRRVIIMDKMGPHQTHLYGDTQARVESTRITYEVVIEENTRELQGFLGDLRGVKFTYSRNIAVRIIHKNSPFKDKLAAAFNSWADNALVWIHGETAPRYLDNSTRVIFYVRNTPESPTN